MKDKLNCPLNYGSSLEVSYYATVTCPLHLYCGSRIVVNFDNSSKLLLVINAQKRKQINREVREVFKQAAFIALYVASGQNIEQLFLELEWALSQLLTRRP